MKAYQLALATTVLAMASMAHAGKAERDFYAAEVQPAITSAAATLKKACGADVKFDVQVNGYQTVDQMRQIRNFVNSITADAPAYCNDDASKKAISALKTVSISRTSSAGFTFAAGKGTATTDESSYPHWGMMTSAIDK